MMILLSAAAVAAAQPAVQPAPADPAHAEHQQKQGEKAGCACCKDMAGGKMACCAKHESKGAESGDHGDHGAK